MSEASQLSPELARGILQLARALLVAARNWTLYPPEHPAVGTTVDRLCDAIRQSSLGSAFAIGITPHTLLIDGASADGDETAIAEAAALLHNCDLVYLTFLGDISRDGICALLRLLALDAEELRRRGGPEKIWATEGHPSLILEQIDYERLLSRREGEVIELEKRDDLWRSIVLSVAGGQKAVFDERAQQRLLEIAGNPSEIRDLVTAAMAPQCAVDGSPMITSQAAAVLAAFHHLMSIVSVMSPDRMPEVMNSLAAAACQLDPHVVMQLMQTENDPDEETRLVTGLAAAFDDMKVARLLATAMALDGQASDRLATIFNTIAPDEDRKRRVLGLTRNLLSETDFGKTSQFQTLWTSAQELLVSYNEKPFVSEAYHTSLDGLGGRAERMAAVDLPPELPEWIDSLGQDNVRSLSVTLLIDLLTIEQDEARAGELAKDMEALAEDLLMSGAYDDTRAVTKALADRAGTADAIGRDACRQALDVLGESNAMRETAALLGDIGDADWETMRAVITLIGPPSIEALRPLMASEEMTPLVRRAADMIVGFGPEAVVRVAPLMDDDRWFVQRNGAQLLGRIAAPEGVPLLQSLLRRGHPRVARATVTALVGIRDPSAARAIHTVLRAATGELRRVVVEALVADRDPRVVPVLGRIIAESQPLGKDHVVVLETLAAIGRVGSETGVPTLARALRQRAFFRRWRLRAIKKSGVDALERIGGPHAKAALDEAAKSGDRMLKKIVAARRL